MSIIEKEYGLKDFKELMEKRFKECDDPMNIPFGCDPFSQASINRRAIQKETYNYVLEMLPEQIEIARYSQRLVAQQRAEIERLKVNAQRYEKLRRWMSSNVAEGWDEVVKLGAVGAYVDWNTFDAQLDSLPVCNVGLCEVSS